MSKHELTAENLNLKTTDDGRIVAEVSFVDYLREHGYPIDGVSDGMTIQRPDSDTGHMVYKVHTLNKPTDHPDCDAVADATEIWVCDCGDFTYRKSVDVAEEETLEGIGECVHIRHARNDRNA